MDDKRNDNRRPGNWFPGSGSTSSRQTALALAVFALLVVISVGTISLLESAVAPRLCTTCHGGLAVTKALAMSSHSEFACVTCHRKTGFRLSFGRAAAEATAGEVAKVQPVPNQVCLQCHTANRKVSPSGDINIPHPKHLAQGLQCVNCHKGVVHGQRDLAGAGVVSFKGPAMTTCINCHVDRGITTACSACHTDDRKPVSHKNAAWKTTHGKEAQKDVGVCAMCHSFTKDKAVKISAIADAAEFATKVDFCRNCHGNRPVTHTEDWPVTHRLRAKEDRAACLVCHSESKPGPGATVVVYCQQCHRDLHPANWRLLHPNVVKSIGVLEGKCFNCHISSSCGKCHSEVRARHGGSLKPEPAPPAGSGGSS